MAKLSHDFYAGDTVDTARNLLGKILVRNWNGITLAGRITETEAYIGRIDKACHAWQYRRTRRTETLFFPPGYTYIYLIYGIYSCLNLVTEPEGEPAAVLIRAIEPLAGEEQIWRLRYGDKTPNAYRTQNFLNGPGKVCQGLALSRTENGLDLTGNSIFVCERPEDLGLPAPAKRRERIVSGPRVGIDYAEEARDFPWRFQLLPD